MNKFRIATKDKGVSMTLIEFDFTGADDECAKAGFVKRMEKLGYANSGYTGDRPRKELTGVPKFSGLLGPMWDGDAIRYEDQQTYNELSQ